MSSTPLPRPILLPLIAVLLTSVWLATTAIAQPEPAAKVQATIAAARKAFEAGNHNDALSQLRRAIESQPEVVDLRLTYAEMLATLRDHRGAITAYTAVLRAEPETLAALQGRGDARLKAGDLAEAIADFEKMIELQPKTAAGLWQLGIAYYYVGKYAEGARQFELYQTRDGSDVENVAWRYLCQARAGTVEAARTAMLELDGTDARVPLMEIDALYRGRATPDDVLAAARAGEPSEEVLKLRMFYAHLYIALYHEAAGEQAQAREHMDKADALPNTHYMWDVAHLHAERLRTAEANQAENGSSQ